MATATITSKGQITIPSSMRERLGLRAGTRVEFIEIENGKYAMIPATSPLAALEGILWKPERKPISIEDMDRGIAEEVSKEY